MANMPRLKSIPSAKTCDECGDTKDYSEFYKKSSCADNHQQPCKECLRWRHLERTYGVTKDQYSDMLENQGHSCAICNKTCVTYDVLSVDHDHKTGEIRGLLCQKCNHAIGLFNDDPIVLKNAMEYLDG